MNDQAPRLDASALILAGGKSSRMGQPKALLPFDGEPLIVHTVRSLATRFADIVVVAAPGQELPQLPVTLVHDTVAYQGPVGGISYGLQAARREVCFVTSCDAPFLNLELVAWLVSLSADYDVVVPVWQDRLQPLHAVYRRSLLPRLHAQLARGQLRPVAVYDTVRTRRVDPQEIRQLDPQGHSFRNLNSPEDYQAALELWPSLHGGVRCTVELFGVARLRAKTGSVSLSLPSGADLASVLAALADRLPALRGSVLSQDARRLGRGFACNVNGEAFITDMRTPVGEGDSVLIVSSDAGG